MKTELHQQKIQILGRLIKESSLTLEEALLLLEHEEEEQTPVAPSFSPWHGTTNPYFTQPYTPLTGTITVPNNGSFTTTATITGTNITTTNTSSFSQSVLEELKNATEDADL